MGGGRTSNPEAQKSQIERNIDSFPEQLKPNSEGYIGLPGRSSDKEKRQLKVNDTTSTYEALSNALTRGARLDDDVRVNYGGSSWVHDDGVRITIRPNSRSGSPVIEIVSGNPILATQKIHIEEIK